MSSKKALILKSVATTTNAGWWELKFAIWFGKKITVVDENVQVTLSYWRDKFYLTDTVRVYTNP